MNLSETIIPKSDQLNADDLIAGPLDITITRVERGNSPEQPVTIHYAGADGRPYKPCKSMRRVLVAIWGPDAKAYTGRRVRLYRDDAVRFGGAAVGGIRISHASDIDSTFSLLLTTARSKRAPYKVEPLPFIAAGATAAASEPFPEDRLTYLREQGAEAAALGTAELRAFWKPLTAAEREALTPLLNTWKATASRADADSPLI